MRKLVLPCAAALLIIACPAPTLPPTTTYAVLYEITGEEGEVGEILISFLDSDPADAVSDTITPPWSQSVVRPRDLCGHVYLCARKATVLTDPETFLPSITLSISVDGEELVSDTEEEWNGTVVSVQGYLP